MESTASNSNPSMTSEGTQNDQNDEIAQSKETYAQVKHFRFFNVASNFRGKDEPPGILGVKSSAWT